MVYDVVDGSIRSLLNPELTASWEIRVLTLQWQREPITEEEYMKKLEQLTLPNRGQQRQGTE